MDVISAHFMCSFCQELGSCLTLVSLFLTHTFAHSSHGCDLGHDLLLRLQSARLALSSKLCASF